MQLKGNELFCCGNVGACAREGNSVKQRPLRCHKRATCPKSNARCSF